MAKITRANQKIFGSTASAGQIGVFGSLAAGSASTTTNPETIQSLSNYLAGWFAATIGQNSPAIEDMNALFYLYAYQLAYMFQAGIAEWDDATTYYTGSLVMVDGVIYRSTGDNNLNNDPATTASTSWSTPIINGLLSNVTISQNITVVSGKILFYPLLIIAASTTHTINSGGYLKVLESITVNGTLVVNGTATVV